MFNADVCSMHDHRNASIVPQILPGNGVISALIAQFWLHHLEEMQRPHATFDDNSTSPD